MGELGLGPRGLQVAQGTVGILHLWLMPASPVWFPGSGAALSELAQGLWLLVPTVSSVEKAKAVWLSALPSPITLAITCGVSVSGLAECQVTGPREVSPPLKLGRGGGLSRSRNQPTGPGSCFLQSQESSKLRQLLQLVTLARQRLFLVLFEGPGASKLGEKSAFRLSQNTTVCRWLH